MYRKAFYTLSPRDTIPSTEVHLEKPKIVSILVNDKGHQMKPLERMKYFRHPPSGRFPLDLNEGIESYIHRKSAAHFNKGINKIAFYLMNRSEEGEVVDEILQHEVITSRGALIDIMTAPYSPKTKWSELRVTRFNNKLFIKRGESLYTVQSPRSTYHFKLHQHCFSDDPKHEPDTSQPIDENDQLYCIYRSRMKNLKLLYSGEMNGVISDEKLEDLHDWKEVNKKRFVFTKLGKRNIFQFWCKSYLSAVTDVYLADGDKSGLVFKLDHKDVSDLPNGHNWNQNVCIAFMYKFLTMILAEMKDINCPYTTYIFSKDAGSKTIYLNIHNGKTKHSFLTEDFIEHLKK